MKTESPDTASISQSLSEALGERLLAVYRFGTNFAHGQRGPLVRLLVLVDQIDRPLLDALVPIAKKARKVRAIFRLDTRDSLLRGADAFPAFSLELLGHRELIKGADVLGELRVEPNHLRLHVEQGLRAIYRDLVKMYLENPGRKDLVHEFRRAAHKMIFLFEGALIAGGFQLPEPRTPDRIVQALSSTLQPSVEPDIWTRILSFSQDDLELNNQGFLELYGHLLLALMSIINVVDQMDQSTTTA